MKKKQCISKALLSTFLMGILAVGLQAKLIAGTTRSVTDQTTTTERPGEKPSTRSEYGGTSGTTGQPSTSTGQKKYDGPKTFQNSDGSTIQINPDGSKVIKRPDGTSVEIKPDGSKTIRKPDGTTVDVKPGGQG